MKNNLKCSVLGIVCLCTAVGGLSVAQAKTAVATAQHPASAASSSTKGSLSYPVNINTADASTLATLPGVGTSRAKAIVSYRQAHGNFKSIDDLAGVRGVSKSYIDKNKQYLTVK